MKTKPTYAELLAAKFILEEENRRMSERIAYLERMLYGSKRDRRKPAPNQGPGLFDEEIKEVLDQKQAVIEHTVREIREEAEKRRKRSKTQSARPAKYHCYDLEERERIIYPEGINLEDYDVIDRDVTRILHYTPAKLWIDVIIRPVLRHKEDKGKPSPRIEQAGAPKAVIGGNHVAADMLAQIVAGKYTYHMPEYRQVKQYADLGVKLSTSTLNDWVHAVADKLYPLYEAHQEDIRARGYLQVDEVPWRIADRAGQCRKGYAWQFFDATPDSHGLYFHYHKGSRAGEIPRAQLRGYRGAIQTDGYSVYDYFETVPDVTLLGCTAHVRRKFVEAQKSHPALASKALDYITLLYELEANLKASGATAQTIALERQAKAIPLMDAMEQWMKAVSKQCTPSDLMGKALDYAYKLWPRLRRYTENGDYRIDNNAVERMQRPSVLGRKNYLFSKNDRGAEDNAVFYTLLESCAIVGVNPLHWLTHVLDKLKEDPDEEHLVSLLPYNYKKSQG